MFSTLFIELDLIDESTEILGYADAKRILFKIIEKFFRTSTTNFRFSKRETRVKISQSRSKRQPFSFYPLPIYIINHKRMHKAISSRIAFHPTKLSKSIAYKLKFYILPKKKKKKKKIHISQSLERKKRFRKAKKLLFFIRYFFLCFFMNFRQHRRRCRRHSISPHSTYYVSFLSTDVGVIGVEEMEGKLRKNWSILSSRKSLNFLFHFPYLFIYFPKKLIHSSVFWLKVRISDLSITFQQTPIQKYCLLWLFDFHSFVFSSNPSVFSFFLAASGISSREFVVIFHLL